MRLKLIKNQSIQESLQKLIEIDKHMLWTMILIENGDNLEDIISSTFLLWYLTLD